MKGRRPRARGPATGREAEPERRARLRRAERLQAIGTLAGGVAHDLNNVLAAILTHAELLRMGLAGNAEALENVDAITAATERAAGLVDQILAFGRRRAGERRALDLVPVTRQALRLVRAGLPSGIALRSVLPAGPVTVDGDPTEIHQVVTNLCTNAAGAMPGGGELAVSLEVVEVAEGDPAGIPPGGHVRLEVRDSGVGMAPAVLERAFEPFFTTRGAQGGTGLGLAVVRGVVTAMGGRVVLESQPGRGTTARVLLPRVAGEGPPAP